MGLFNKKKYICCRCEKEIPAGRSQKFCGKTYCIECALFVRTNGKQEAEEREKLKIIEEAQKSKFYYNVEDSVEAYLFWQNEVDKAHEQLNLQKISQKTSWEEITKGYGIKELILIKSTPDYEYPDKVDWDWDTLVGVYYNETTDAYMFSLTEDFNSTWDGFPVFRGGEISLELFENYMKIIDNHKYDELIAKLKKQKNYQ